MEPMLALGSDDAAAGTAGLDDEPRDVPNAVRWVRVHREAVGAEAHDLKEDPDAAP
jgi:hypothetical protein